MQTFPLLVGYIDQRGQHLLGKRRVRFPLGIRIQSGVEIVERTDKRRELSNVGKHLGAAVQQRAQIRKVQSLQIRIRRIKRQNFGMELLRRQLFHIQRVEPPHFCLVEDRGRLAHAVQRKQFFHFGQRHFFAVVFGAPPQKRNIVYDRVFQVAFGNKIFVVGVAVPLGQFLMRIAHDGLQMDILRTLPPQRIV